MTSIADFRVARGDGEAQDLAGFADKVLLVVNTASQCGFTPQYEGLETLQRRYGEAGFSVLAFPCNQFGGQEPGSAEEIAGFCAVNYDVTFPVFAKVDVNGPAADPLWRWMRAEAPGVLGTTAIKWNFTKFLVGRDGQVARRYAPTDKPGAIAADIEAIL